MDRQAKERLIGAIVLVAAAWLVLPVFLDGPGPQDGIQDERELTLPQLEQQDSSPASVKRQTVVLEEAGEPATPIQPLPTPAGRDTAEVDGSAAGRDDASAAAAEPEAVPETVVSEPADAAPPPPVAEAAADPVAAPEQEPETPATAEADTAEVSAGAQLWAVQIGSFSDKENADRLAAELREAGYPAFLSQISSGGRTLHRVRVGPQADRAASEAMQARLSAAGYRGRPVRHP
jgi:DedD protein